MIKHIVIYIYIYHTGLENFVLADITYQYFSIELQISIFF